METAFLYFKWIQFMKSIVYLLLSRSAHGTYNTACTKMVAVHIYGKNLLPRNQKADNFETWYAALGAQVLLSSNGDPRLALTYFMARSNLVPYAFIWETGKTVDFSDTIVVYDVKVGKCN